MPLWVVFQRHLSELGSLPIGSKLPKFSAKDVNGKTVNNTTFQGKDVVIISTWAAWSYESLDVQRALSDAVKAGKDSCFWGICVDVQS